ncbi:MAG: hypothetical protein RR317_06215 [Bilophila sp.]
MEKKPSFIIEQEIFIHLMTSAYKEGLKAGKALASEYDATVTLEAATTFYHGLSDMLTEPATAVQH